MKLETQVGLFIVAAIAVFLYLSINIKAFRFDKNHYNEYKTYFDDTGGVTVKSAVKIAGVDVGWVENVRLLHGGKAELILRVDRRNKLAKNSFAMIHQDGLIGNKTVEIDPGDPSTGILLPGSTLSMPGRTPTSVGELLEQFRSIATTVQDITSSIKNVFASRQGEDNMRNALDSIAKASDRIADVALVLQKTMHNNEQQLNQFIADMSSTVASLKTAVPGVADDIHTVGDSFKTNATTIATDFHDVSGRVGGAFEHIENTAIQAHDTFREASQVMEKINTGKGVVGKLINEDETYGDIKQTVRGLKNYVNKTQSLMVNIDMHSESMLRFTNTKGYAELQLRTNTDCFYLLQLVADEFGSVTRDTTYYARRDSVGNTINTQAVSLTPWEKLFMADEVERVVRTPNAILFGLQFGKRFDRLALRVGLMESSFGVGCDFYVPLQTDKFHWITTLEAFDLRGYNRYSDDVRGFVRFRDRRPHVKWINRLFFMNNLYTAFGVDDIYSKRMATPFWGGGLRFGDDDLKYFLSMFKTK